MITLLEDGDLNGVFSGFEDTPSSVVVSGIEDKEYILNEMKTRRNAIRKNFRMGDGFAIRNYMMCVTENIKRLPVIAELFEDVTDMYSSFSYMDIIVLATSRVKESAREALAAAEKISGLRIFYIDYDELSLDDVKGVCANIAENSLAKDKFLGAGFYFLRVSIGSMGDFQLFYELSARRLEEAEKKGKLELNASDMRDFTRGFMDNTFKFQMINSAAFRYLLWNKKFQDRFEESGRYHDRDPFAENAKRFINLNCSDPFHKYMDEMRQIEGQFYNLFFDKFLNDFENIIGKTRIEIMGKALELLRRIKYEIEEEQQVAAIDSGNKPTISETDNLWAYSDYMYKNYFKRKMEYERFSCELEFINAFYTEIDKAAIRERKNLDAFNKMIDEKRNKSNTDNKFAQAIYDKISDLFKNNREAESFLLKCIKEYLNSLNVSGYNKESSAGMALFASTAEEFRSIMENNVNVVFMQDLSDGIKNDFDNFAQSLLPEPTLLIGSCSYDTVKQELEIEEPVLDSFKSFKGYESELAKILEHDENTVALYKYYKINTGNTNIMSILTKII